ncbi:hypothetical protein PULV_a2536 [Pseudoalteromonas ulvae UL12]|nr:hypothetical protein [Pseudoalteromonas ulvae UL12]
MIEQNLQYVAQVFPPSHYSLTKYQLDKMTISNQGFKKNKLLLMKLVPCGG